MRSGILGTWAGAVRRSAGIALMACSLLAASTEVPKDLDLAGLDKACRKEMTSKAFQPVLQDVKVEATKVLAWSRDRRVEGNLSTFRDNALCWGRAATASGPRWFLMWMIQVETWNAGRHSFLAWCHQGTERGISHDVKTYAFEPGAVDVRLDFCGFPFESRPPSTRLASDLDSAAWKETLGAPLRPYVPQDLAALKGLEDGALEDLRLFCRHELVAGARQGSVTVDEVEVLAWYRWRDPHPWYMDMALCWARVATPGGPLWCVLVMVRIPQASCGHWSLYTMDGLGFDLRSSEIRGLRAFKAPPRNSELYASLGKFTFAGTDGRYTNYASWLDVALWTRLVGEPPTRSFPPLP